MKCSADTFAGLEKRIPNISGIYSLTCINGKRYIGSARNIRGRWHGHIWNFKRSSAPIKLQRAWDKHGAQSFIFELILICAEQDLLLYEELAIAAYDAVSNGYNVRMKPGSNLGLKLPQSEECKRKISAANKIAYKGRPGPWPKGKPHPIEMRQKQSASRRQLFRKYAYGGYEMCLSDWADKNGISVNALQNRIARGWPLDRALTEPSRGY